VIQSRRSRNLLRAGTAATLAFIYFPLAVLTLYAFNSSRVVRWPIDGLSLRWLDLAKDNPGARDALSMSVKVGLLATVIALVLGSLAAFAVARYHFFGRDAVSFLVVIPIALPGIATGMALNATFTQAPVVKGIPFGTFTMAVGHATFCIVVVYNNVLARLRRTSKNLEEASADLGANPIQTFRYVTFPALRTALLAGALLAFALSFDEIIVTRFTVGDHPTLPLWIFNNYSRPNQGPIVNAVGLFAILGSIIPVYVAQRLSADDGATTTPTTGAAAAAP
jgi:putative spermidine/putrescine transport system permease protein